MSTQPVNLQERRQERLADLGDGALLAALLKAVTQVRQILKTGVLVGGTWVWTEYELQATPTTQAPSPAPRPQERKQAEPMTFGRDPAKHLITFGRFFKENDSKPLTIEQAADQHGLHELYGYWEYIEKQDEPGQSLEVLGEMITAFLLERQYDPKTRPEKYKTPRRGNNREWGGGR